jgi:hypothetical protein
MNSNTKLLISRRKTEDNHSSVMYQDQVADLFQVYPLITPTISNNNPIQIKTSERLLSLEFLRVVTMVVI